MISSIGNATQIAPGVYVSDQDILAAGGSPTQLRQQLGQSPIALGKANVGPLTTHDSPCVQAARAKQMGQPDRIVAALDAKCAAFRSHMAMGVSVNAAEPDPGTDTGGHTFAQPSEGEDNTKLYIAGAVVAAVALLLVAKKLKKRK